MPRDLETYCGMNCKQKLVEVQEGRKYGSEEQRNILTKLSLSILVFGSKANEWVRCRCIVYATNICQFGVIRTWTPGIGVLPVSMGG